MHIYVSMLVYMCIFSLSKEAVWKDQLLIINNGQKLACIKMEYDNP